MFTYNQGTWGEDTTQEDNWSIGVHDKITINGIEMLPLLQFGYEYLYHAFVYSLDHDNFSEDAYKPYNFFVTLGDAGDNEIVLVTNYPSVLMLVKEVQPLIQISLETHKVEMIEEEHQWKGRDRWRETGKQECQHLY